MCAPARTRAERGYRQATSALRASAHLLGSFYLIGNSVSYQVKRASDRTFVRTEALVSTCQKKEVFHRENLLLIYVLHGNTTPSAQAYVPYRI